MPGIYRQYYLQTNKTNYESLKEKQEEPHRYLVLSGAGVKGTAFVGVITELEKHNVIQHLYSVSGSSAGSIVASLVAAGVSAERIKSVLDAGLKTLAGKPHGSSSLFKKLLGSDYKHDASILYQAIKLELLHSAVSYTKDKTEVSLKSALISGITRRKLQINTALTQSKESTLVSERLTRELEILNNVNFEQKLKQFLSHLKNDNYSITFSDLYLLRLIDPDKFKGLVITAANLSTATTELFDFSINSSPDVEIAKAVLASSALPIYFDTVDIDLNDGNGPQKFCDGGLVDYIPQRYFSTLNGRILSVIFAFPEQHRAMYGNPNTDITSYRKSLTSLIREQGLDGFSDYLTIPTLKLLIKYAGGTTHHDFAETAFEQTHRELRTNAVDVLVIAPQHIGSVDWDQEQRQRQYLVNTGALATTRFLNTMTTVPMYDNSDSIEFKEALKKLYDLTYGKVILETSHKIALLFNQDIFYAFNEIENTINQLACNILNLSNTIIRDIFKEVMQPYSNYIDIDSRIPILSK